MIDSARVIPTRRYTVVVPCYNEELRIPIIEYSTFLAAMPVGTSLLFVNDGSCDRTGDILNSFASEFPLSVSIVNQQSNLGKAESVRAGMLRAMEEGATLTGFWDADLATPLEELPRLLSILEERNGFDILIGARVRLLGRDVSRKGVRHYCGRLFATLASLTLNLPVYDTQCGAKIFRVTPLLREVLSKPFLSRWIFDVELLARYLAHKRQNDGFSNEEYAIYEEPLNVWHDVDGSKLRAIDSLRAIWELIRIRRLYFKS